MKKKRSVTLIEVIFSLGLLAFLLSSLFFWYHSMTKQKKILADAKWPTYEEKFCLQRLNVVIPKIKPPLMSSGQTECAFLFDNGVAAESYFSGTILGKLYIADKALNFQIWPHPKNRQDQTQVVTLIDSVERCEFAFYSPPELESKVVNPEGVHEMHPRHEGWQPSWSPEYTERPALIKIILKRFGKETEFIFDLQKTILYPTEEKAV